MDNKIAGNMTKYMVNFMRMNFYLVVLGAIMHNVDARVLFKGNSLCYYYGLACMETYAL